MLCIADCTIYSQQHIGSSFCALQESAHSSLVQQTGVSRINVSSHAGITQRGTLLVIAEAVLAAVVQAEAGAAPTKRKKAAAEVITGMSVCIRQYCC